MLTYQLSSFVLYPPEDNQLKVTIFHAKEDQPVVETLKFFESIQVNNIDWNFRALKPERLCRRSVGRNDAALKSEADWIWFADCDMPFRSHFEPNTGTILNPWDQLATKIKELPEEIILTYPRIVNISVSHASGDKYVEAIDGPLVVDIDPKDFGRRKYRRAIGGVQVVKGDVVREIGYLNGHRRAQRSAARWLRTYEDVRFRKTLRPFGRGRPVAIGGVFRIRHSKRGRQHEGVKL